MTSGPSVRHALFLARLGLSVLWKRSPAGGPVKGRGKAPVMLGWNAQPCQSPAQLVKVYRPGYNLGLHTGAVTGCAIPLVAADSDTPESERWAAIHLPATPLSAASDRGIHRYYRHPGPGHFVPTRQKIALAGGLDVLGDNGATNLPPSVHPSGAQYRFLCCDFFADAAAAERVLEALPVWVEGWIPKPAYQPLKCSAPYVARDTAPDLARAERWLAKRDPAVSGQGGHSWTYKTALQLLQRFELSPDAALQLLHIWNQTCDPPWSDSELRHKVIDASKSRLQLGRLAPSRGR